jgi:hypothetical protein
MLGVTQLKLTQFLENHQNFESNWVIRFIVTFNKKLKPLLTT